MRSVLINLHSREVEDGDTAPIDSDRPARRFPKSPQVLAVLGGAAPAASPDFAPVLELISTLGQAHRRRWNAMRLLGAPGTAVEVRARTECELTADTELAAALVTGIDALARTTASDGGSVGRVLSGITWWWIVASPTDVVVRSTDESFQRLFEQCAVYNTLVDAMTQEPRG